MVNSAPIFVFGFGSRSLGVVRVFCLWFSALFSAYNISIFLVGVAYVVFKPSLRLSILSRLSLVCVLFRKQ